MCIRDRDAKALSQECALFLAQLEDGFDREMRNAALVLQEAQSAGHVDLQQMRRVNEQTGMSDLYLFNPDGSTRLSTVKGAETLNLYSVDVYKRQGVVVLQDDKGLYPSYMCGFVVRKQVLQAHPALQAVFDRVEHLITDAEMAEMNNQVEAAGKSPEAVAAAFLERKGLLR